ncbi:hypothethical protein (plasmid) [Ralstonia solanacearum PSI07]|uniref:Uncharacterized protein n=1 Tax=blood disease bacterium R229 TaxID=741978 RepID=G2ZS73_9RALS|nr:hypothethical protein [Ralstonia solanacearum PSI07]CCA81895.1 conserved hypothetical protein [blood disease bacterium R229]
MIASSYDLQLAELYRAR